MKGLLLVLLTLPPLTTSFRPSLTCKVGQVRGCLSQLMGNKEQSGRLSSFTFGNELFQFEAHISRGLSGKSYIQQE